MIKAEFIIIIISPVLSVDPSEMITFRFVAKETFIIIHVERSVLCGNRDTFCIGYLDEQKVQKNSIYVKH